MRFAIAIFACALAVANAQLGQYNNFGKFPAGQYNRYQPFNKFNNQGYKPFVTSTPFPPRPAPARATASVSVTPSAFVQPARVPVPVAVPVAKISTDARSAETVKSGSEINPDGSFNHFFETSNGISAQAQGTPRNFGGNPPVIPSVIQGSFSWVAPEGKTVTVTYVADENGYQPQSDAIPVAPPVPELIARALDYIAKYGKNQ